MPGSFLFKSNAISAGALSDKTGSRAFSMLGMVFSTASLVLFGMMVHAGVLAHWLLILGLSLSGLGTGTFAAPNNSAILGLLLIRNRVWHQEL
jgi:MFS family permease